jgi:hypothetical protein
MAGAVGERLCKEIVRRSALGYRTTNPIPPPLLGGGGGLPWLVRDKSVGERPRDMWLCAGGTPLACDARSPTGSEPARKGTGLFTDRGVNL